MEINENYDGQSHSMSENNVGSAGGDPPEKLEKEGDGSFRDIGLPKVNETGFAENEENHGEENYVQNAIKKRMDGDAEYPDPTAPGNTRQPAKNHIKNIGGTSEEDKNDDESPNGHGL